MDPIPTTCRISSRMLKRRFAGLQHTLGQKSSIYPKIHIFKASFFTKFTFSKPYFSQNSQCQSLIFLKIHIFKVLFFTKFTLFKHQILGNFWIKRWFLPQCAPPKVANGRSHTIIMQVKRLSGWSFFLLPFDAMLWGTMDWKPALLLENLTVVQYAAAACFSSVVWRHNILWLPPLESLGNY